MVSAAVSGIYEKLFGRMTLPNVAEIKALGANGATITLLEEPVRPAKQAPFFGGYAEDMLADIGMEGVDSQPQPGLRAKRV